jgi:hypothetical protein
MLLANYYVWYHTGEHKTAPYAGWTRPRQKELPPGAKKYGIPGEPEIASMCYPLEGSL